MQRFELYEADAPPSPLRLRAIQVDLVGRRLEGAARVRVLLARADQCGPDHFYLEVFLRAAAMMESDGEKPDTAFKLALEETKQRRGRKP